MKKSEINRGTHSNNNIKCSNSLFSGHENSAMSNHRTSDVTLELRIDLLATILH